MRKLIPVYLTLLISLNAFHIFAQQKYALIIGINKYYDKPEVLHQPQLHGCVNDAMSMKNLLLQQFGFNEKNIHTILDEQATKESLLGSLKNILDNAKTGDAVVFYYSGHGAWLSNKSQSIYDSTVKHGQNQGMVMSNLYAPNLNCIVRDADLKMIANKFVDKDVVFTMIADCCFSGLIVLPATYAIRNPYHKVEPYIEGGGRSLGLYELINIYKSAEKEKASSLTDEDVLKVLDNKEGADTALRSFNLKDALIIHDSTFITRPSERPHSMFLSLSASFQYEPALEETDETNTRHGIFTKAIIDAIKNNSPEMPVAELMKKVNQTILTQQRYPQSPQHHEDPARLMKNFLGITPNGFRRNTIVSVMGVAGNKITLRGGVWSNLAAGNILSAMQGNSKIKLRINQAFTDSSEAMVINGNVSSVKQGDKFMVTDNYAASAPLIKLFIGSKDFTPSSFKNFIDKKIIPLTLMRNYMDYENWYSIKSYTINFSEAEDKAEKNAQKILRGEIRDSFVIMLPIPSYIAGPLKAAVQKNQNVVLVNSAAEADYVLYLNYVQINPIDVKHPYFVFTWNHLMKPEYNAEWGDLMFIDQNAKTKTAQLLSSDVNFIAPKLAATPNVLIRENSGHWLNFMPKQ